MMNNRETFRARTGPAFRRTVGLFRTVLPMLAGILLLIGLLHQFLSDSYPKWFSGNYLLDPLIGAVAGSVSFGIPITSYVAGGELLQAGVSLLAVTAFVMAWTTVGLVMIPIEASELGLRFTVIRNLVNFVFSLLVAIATVLTLGFLP